MGINGKACSKCNKYKLIEEFYFDKKNRRYFSECKECLKIRSKELRDKNKNKNEFKIIESNLTKVCSKCKEVKNLNDFYKVKCNSNGISSECKECIKSSRKKYQENNKNAISEKSKEHYTKNRERIIKKNVEYEFNRRQSDVNYRIRRNVHSSFRNFIKNKGNSFKEYVGYSYKELLEHLNYNNVDTHKYHVDHIIPKNLYDHLDKEEIKKCWSLRNLRLITERDNLKRSKNIDWNLVERYDLYDILPKGIKHE